MPTQKALDAMYMQIAAVTAEMSHAIRKKVGALLVKENNIISYGWNGTPSGDDNSCEIHNADGSLTTKPEVLHAESNVLSKLLVSGGTSSANSTMYVTLSPCIECAKLIKQSKISRVVYKEEYRDTGGIDFLQRRGVIVEKMEGENVEDS